MNILKQLQNLDKTDLECIYKELYNKNIRGNKKRIISNILSPLNISYKFTVNNVGKLKELRTKRKILKKEKDKLKKEQKKLFKMYRNTTSICLTHPEELEERQKIEKELEKIEKELEKIKKEFKKLYQIILKDFPFK